MSITVHILATCRKPELLPFTELVFRTLRVGFPTAKVIVHDNALPDYARASVLKLADQNSCLWKDLKPTIHHRWIESLLAEESQPFFLLDTDCIFYQDFEQFIPQFAEQPLAGYRIPEWRDEFSGCITRARLHTSLLYLNPYAIADSLQKYIGGIADTPFTPKVNPIHPLVLPFKQQPYFYDTCSLLYHAIGGFSFTDEMKDAYTHLHFGTIPDVVLPRLPEETAKAMTKARAMILENPARGHGSWRIQDQFYANRQA